MKSTETIAFENKMQNKAWRFIWFARQSWGYQKGQRLSASFRFFGAWRRFSAKVSEDLNK